MKDCTEPFLSHCCCHDKNDYERYNNHTDGIRELIFDQDGYEKFRSAYSRSEETSVFLLRS